MGYTSSGYEFPPTAWSVVLASAEEDPRGSREALGRLLATYLPVLKAYLVRHKGVSHHDAEDILHDFVHKKVLVNEMIASARKSKGRFRSYLKRSLENVWIEWLRAGQAQKRMPEGGVAGLPEDGLVREPALSPADTFDVLWARQVVEEAKRRTREHYESSGHPEIWAVFELRLLAPIMDGAQVVPYREMVERCGFLSPHQAANALTTAKRGFHAALREVLAESVQDPEDVDDELKHLLEVLQRAGPKQY